MSLLKVNATSVQTLGDGQERGYGQGRGRGCGQGHGKHNSSHCSGSQSRKKTTQTTKSGIIQRHNLKRG